jgi:hypothetical protein
MIRLLVSYQLFSFSNELLNHPVGLAIGILLWRMFAEICRWTIQDATFLR